MYGYLWVPTEEAGYNFRLSAFKLFTHFSDSLFIQNGGVVRRVFWEQVTWQILFKPLMFPEIKREKKQLYQ